MINPGGPTLAEIVYEISNQLDFQLISDFKLDFKAPEINRLRGRFGQNACVGAYKLEYLSINAFAGAYELEYLSIRRLIIRVI